MRGGSSSTGATHQPITVMHSLTQSPTSAVEQWEGYGPGNTSMGGSSQEGARW